MGASGRSCPEPRVPRCPGQPGTHSLTVTAAGRCQWGPRHTKQARCWWAGSQPGLQAWSGGQGRGHCQSQVRLMELGRPGRTSHWDRLGRALTARAELSGSPCGGKRPWDTSWKWGLKIASALRGLHSAAMCPGTGAWKNRHFLPPQPLPQGQGLQRTKGSPAGGGVQEAGHLGPGMGCGEGTEGTGCLGRGPAMQIGAVERKPLPLPHRTPSA